MKGTITTIKSNAGQGGGFGFIRDEAGQDRFFHLSSVTDGIPVEGADVDFEPYNLKGSAPDKKNNGLRARHVRVEPPREDRAGQDDRVGPGRPR